MEYLATLERNSRPAGASRSTCIWASICRNRPSLNLFFTTRRSLPGSYWFAIPRIWIFPPR